MQLSIFFSALYPAIICSTVSLPGGGERRGKGTLTYDYLTEDTECQPTQWSFLGVKFHLNNSVLHGLDVADQLNEVLEQKWCTGSGAQEVGHRKWVTGSSIT